jgi:uncharacterized membrane protein SpoIIM required for sporulation
MNEEVLVNRRMAEWKRLEELCALADMRVQTLNHTNLLEFIRLYKRASTDLATIRTRSENEPLALYLNNLVVRAHSIIYRSPRQKLGQAVADFILNVPRTYRRNRPFFWTSFAIFFGSVLFTFFLVNSNREYLEYFAMGSDDLFDGWKQGVHEENTAGGSAGMTLFYAGNNPKVSIIAGAIGAGSMGLMSLAMLFQNGAMLGALASEMHSVNKLYFLLSSVAPHGVPELSGIIFSASAGLKFGWALFRPGVYTRAESLKKAGPDGLMLILIGVILCFIAAPIEGFFSFNPNVPQGLKVGFAVVTLCVWVWFWSFYGREPENSEKQPQSH